MTAPFTEPALDKEGFLRQLDDWSPAVAEWLAGRQSIDLTEAHWEIIHLVRAYYERYHLSPAMRVLVNVTKAQLGPEKGRSIHLMLLFPGKTARLISQIAGLPKPDNCD